VSEFATTGDGVLTALLMGAQVAAGASLRDQCSSIHALPQVLLNIPGADRSRVNTDEVLQEAVGAARKELGNDGRVLLRSSGTEALVRVMVEAGTKEDAQRHASALAAVVADRLCQ